MADEEELLLACVKGDRKAQTAFYNLYKGRLMSICKRYARTTAEAEDIYQEAFIKVFSGMAALQRSASVASWVKTIVVRTAIDYYRSTLNHQQQTGYEEVTDHIDRGFDALAQLQTEDIFNAINTLPDSCRLVVNMYLIDNYTHEEIAKLLDIAPATSRSHLFRGKELLRIKLSTLGLADDVRRR